MPLSTKMEPRWPLVATLQIADTLDQSGTSRAGPPTWLGGLAEASGGGGAGGPEGVLVGRVFAGLPAQTAEEPASGHAAARGPGGAGPEQTTTAGLLLLLLGKLV